MSFSAFLEASRRRGAVALRLLVWPAAILLLSDLAASTQDDGLAAGLLAFATTVSLGSLLALADGLVLRVRPLVLVWSVTTVVAAGLLNARPVVDVVLHGPDRWTWAEAVQLTLEDLPSSLAFYLGLVGVPVAVGAVTGLLLQHLVLRRPGRITPAADLGAPRG